MLNLHDIHLVLLILFIAINLEIETHHIPNITIIAIIDLINIIWVLSNECFDLLISYNDHNFHCFHKHGSSYFQCHHNLRRYFLPLMLTKYCMFDNRGTADMFLFETVCPIVKTLLNSADLIKFNLMYHITTLSRLK